MKTNIKGTSSGIAHCSWQEQASLAQAPPLPFSQDLKENFACKFRSKLTSTCQKYGTKIKKKILKKNTNYFKEKSDSFLGLDTPQENELTLCFNTCRSLHAKKNQHFSTIF